MITISKENYLKAVLEAESEGEHVISATLAHRLFVTAPAVTTALRRLKRDGLVSMHADGRVGLTTAGRAVALRTMMRHHLIERMLAEVFGMKWYQVHEEAEQLEHAVSAEFEAKLAQKLGPAGICPRGNPVVPESPKARRRAGAGDSGFWPKRNLARATACVAYMSAIQPCCDSSTNAAYGPAPGCTWLGAVTTRP
jgi:DtxR family Mn-dependent transcriptional regulator